MNPSKWPPEILDIRVSGETVRILAVKGTSADNFAARTGAISVPFHREDESADLTTAFEIDLLRLTAQDGGTVFSQSSGDEGPGLKRLGVNLDPSWTLPNDEVHFAQITAGATAMEFVLGSGAASLIPVSGGCPYVARCLSAVHRCEGELVVSFVNAQGSVVGRASDAFDRKFQGGTEIRNYKQLEVHCTAPPSAVAAKLSVRLNETVDVVEGHDSYLFWAKPEFIELATSGLNGKHNGSAKGGGIHNRTDILAASFAGLDIGHTRDELVVEVGERRYPVLPAAGLCEIGPLTEIEGNIVYASAARKGQTKLYIDHVAAADGIYEQAAKRFRFAVPLSVMDGQVHRLEVRDVTGFRIHQSDLQLFPMMRTPYEAVQLYTSSPHPFHLSHAAAFRYRSLIAHLERAKPAEIATLHRLHGVLVSGFESLRRFEPLEFPEHAAPDFSIVIPVHNKFNVTYYCLCALLFAYNDASFEVVLVDDGSTDDTSDVEKLVTGITVVRHEEAQGFVGACNAGAAMARGRYILFLNNDTEPTLRWLDELLRVFSSRPDAGIAGSRLLYPTGKQQDAGGIVWANGNPWNYGRLANPWEPRFSYLRQADYLSGAALAVRADVWAEVGGFSEEMRPAYFEDTDIAFKVREKGYKTFYVPHSIVYHFEGLSNGTDTQSGLKRYQEVNRPKFKRKWAEAFRGHGKEGNQPDLEKDRGIVGRVLFIDHQMPRPDFDAGSYAAIQEMRLVQSLGLKVTFVPDNMAYLGHYSEDLQRLGIETIHAPFMNSVEEFLSLRGSEFDAVYLTRYQVARKFVDLIRSLAPQAKILFNNADLHFLREIRAAIHKQNKSDLVHALQTRDAELEVMRRVDLTLSYNDAEHAVILSHNLDSTKVAKCPWVVESPAEIKGYAEREGIAFLGGFAHPPNAEAVDYFVSDVMPELRKKLPNVKLHVYGAQMPPEIEAMAVDDIVIEGHVESVSTVYDRHRVFIAPLQSGAGIKGKVIGAMAHGIPCVLSRIAAEGTGVRSGQDCMVADRPSEWVNAIRSVYRDDNLWSRLSANGLSLVQQEFSVEKGKELMSKAFETVGIFSSVR